ncbi:G-type lectin S-receptor-like serine/threonine-protein kinase SD2-5 [Cinnamomum micranthum f. kanehirae]|uniref:G-type lectin S-receptor-like serine/threonine-protein kinase SD2-5 n=1 Tax=Cinnamomum micranthum f. kanehirae TaxID=337451 RepID=A0A3S3MH13_9MAGN|nr:G-type lectin S-receptor-like serine/threonine-protein kinase SD2-5 [Cinnamomum micranthum f. kanehirae]
MPEMPKKFSYKEVHLATNDFKEILGRGGFGSFKRWTMVDVKRLEGVDYQGVRQFLTEINTIGNINHFNLVRLVGYCAEKSYRLLVKKYMSNGSLDHWIFRKTKRLALNWPTRKKINPTNQTTLHLHHIHTRTHTHLFIFV